MSDPSNPSPLPPDAPSTEQPPKARGSWWVFFAVLMAPALFTLLTAKSENLWPFFTFPASGLAGLFCGFWLSFRQCQTMPGKILVGLFLAAVFMVVSFALCCAGCALGGASLNIH